MNSFLLFAIISSVVAIVYGLFLAKSILKKSPGNARMQEIAKAIEEGAGAYLNKQ
jgi:K(+)-stimulated pyrophosphate-energized sodium pump